MGAIFKMNHSEIEQATTYISNILSDGFTNLGTTVHDQLGEIKNEIKKKDFDVNITPFSGQSPTDFRNWMSELNKAFLLQPNLSDHDRIRLALRHSTGMVSDYVTLYIKENENGDNPITWENLKNQLTFRFSECSDRDQAFVLLTKMKQQKEENIQNYSTRVLKLALEAFDNIETPEIQRQLVGVFVDGLINDHIKIKLIHQKPQTLSAAAESAVRMQNFQAEVRLRLGDAHASSSDPDDVTAPFRHKHRNLLPTAGRNEVPMEINHMRPNFRRGNDRNEHRGHRENNYRTPRRDQGTMGVRNPNIICYNCSGKGHIARNCPNGKQGLN